MGETNEAIMTRYCLSWRANDFATIAATWSDEIVVHIPGRNPFAGTTRGKKEVLELSVRLQKQAPRYPIDIHDWLVSDNHAVVMATERAMRGGEMLETKRLYIFHLHEGKITELWVVNDDQAAFDRFYA